MRATSRPSRSTSAARGRGRRAGVLVCALLLAIVVTSPRASAEPHPELRDFLPSGHYVLHVEGKLAAKATIYHSKRAAAYLIVDDAFDVGVLVMPRNGCVEAVDTDKVEARDDGGLDVTRDAAPCGLGKFRLVGTDVVFEVKDKKARLKQKPPLLGTHWSSKVIEHSPEYGRAAKKYKPDAAKMKTLAGTKKEARIQIFFGTWCTFCNRFLPNTFKVEEELKKTDAKVTFEFHGLPPPPAAWSTKEALQMRVRRLPTGLIFVDGKMIGRLEGNDWIKPEASLSRVLR